jgi:peptidoglycan hydrolase-like protein with peptidoglycan-binding domain
MALYADVAKALIADTKALLLEIVPTFEMPEVKYDVRWIQTSLNKIGENLAIDGVNGEATKAAVERFQKANGLEVDGWVGTETGAMLCAKTESL